MTVKFPPQAIWGELWVLATVQTAIRSDPWVGGRSDVRIAEFLAPCPPHFCAPRTRPRCIAATMMMVSGGCPLQCMHPLPRSLQAGNKPHAVCLQVVSRMVDAMIARVNCRKVSVFCGVSALSLPHCPRGLRVT